MITLVEHGSEKIGRSVFTTPATVLAHFGEELSYADIANGLYLFEPEDQKKILAGMKQKQLQFWNSIDTVEYYRDTHWQLPGMEEHALRTLQSLTVQNGSVVVDLGCGWGRVAEQLLKLKLDFQYIGFDFSDEMLKTARKHIRELGDGRVLFYNHDLTQGIPLGDNYTDRILANWGIVYFPQDELKFALSEVNRVLKPGGIFVCAAIVEGASFVLLAIRSLFSRPIKSFKKRKVIKKGMRFGACIKKLFPLYTKEQLSLMITEAGQLEIIDMYPTIAERNINIVARKPA
ncbi:MAG: class I SAM-dependent methyltransferase [bacterium]